jgi:hypothetical protein
LHKPLGIDASVHVIHLHIRIEMGASIGVSRVAREIDSRIYRLELNLHPDLLQGFLHDDLRLLADGVHGCLAEDLHAPPILDPAAVAAASPAGLIKPLRRLLKVELPTGIGRLKRRRTIQDVTGDLTSITVEVLDNGAPIHGDVVSSPHQEVGEEGMWHFEAAALAIDLRPGISAIELNVLKASARVDVEAAPRPLPFDAIEHVLLH